MQVSKWNQRLAGMETRKPEIRAMKAFIILCTVLKAMKKLGLFI
jgi:hypothetical protein